MNCRDVRALLPLFADGDLGSEESAAAARHLEACADCRRRLAVDRDLAVALAGRRRAVEYASAPASLRLRVSNAVDREQRPFSAVAILLARAVATVVFVALAAGLLYGLSTLAPSFVGPRPQAPTEPEGGPWLVVRDERLAERYFWPVDGERIDRTPQISPDGRLVALLPTQDGKPTRLDAVVVRDLETGTERDLTPEPGYSYSSTRWSPDGKSLAFVKFGPVSGNGTGTELWRVDADGGNLRLLYRPQPVPDGANGPGFAVVRWTTDGKQIELAPTIWNIWPSGDPYRLIDANGGGVDGTVQAAATWPEPLVESVAGSTVYAPTGDYAVRLVSTAALVEKPAWVDESGNSLVLLDLGTRQATTLASFPASYHLRYPIIAPDGDWIAVRVARASPSGAAESIESIWVVRRDGTGSAEVAGIPEDRRIGEFVWAAAGRGYFNMTPQVWVSRADGRLYELNAHTASARQIAPETWPASVVSTSLDGRSLLVVRGAGEQATVDLLELGPAAPSPGVTVTADPDVYSSSLGLTRAARLSMSDHERGWLWDEATVLRTEDGGGTWRNVTPVLPAESQPQPWQAIDNLFALDADKAWVWFSEGDGVGSVICRTGDGGEAWACDTAPTPGGQLTFVDSYHGWVLASRGAAAGSSQVEVHRTLDGGASWQLVASTTPGQPETPGQIPAAGTKSGIYFRDANRGWIVGSVPAAGSPELYATVDGGVTWSRQNLDLPAEYQTFLADATVELDPPRFFDANNGVLPARFSAKDAEALVVYITGDGGATWTPGAAWSSPDHAPFLFAAGSPDAVWTSNSLQAGDGVRLGRSRDGGRTWETITPSPALTEVGRLRFFDAENGLAFGTSDAGAFLLHTADGGETWTPVEMRLILPAQGTRTTAATPKYLTVYSYGKMDTVYPDSPAFQPLVTVAELALQRMDPELSAAQANLEEAVATSQREGVGLELVYAEAKAVPQKPGPYTRFYLPLAGPPSTDEAQIFIGHARYARLVPAGAGAEFDTLRMLLGVPSADARPGALEQTPLPKPSSAVEKPPPQPSATPTPTSAVQTPACVLAALRATTGWGGATGAMAGVLTLTNPGPAACHLEGRPYVEILDASGTALPVKSAATFERGDGSDPRVELAPGGRARVFFVWRNWCQPEPSLPLAVRLDGALTVPVVDDQGRPMAVLPRCDLPEAQSTLSSGPFEPAE